MKQMIYFMLINHNFIIKTIKF